MPRRPSPETDPEQFPDKPLEYEGTGEAETAILNNTYPYHEANPPHLGPSRPAVLPPAHPQPVGLDQD